MPLMYSLSLSLESLENTEYYPFLYLIFLFCILFFCPKVLEGRSYRLQHPWVGIVNRSQADINRNIDMIYARRKEQEYFATSPDYAHLESKMGSEYLAKLLSAVRFLML